MRAGAGKSEIMLTDEYLEIENFTVIHRALNVRAVALEDKKKNTFVLISLEVTSLPEEEAELIRTRLAENFLMEKASIWVCVTHTFSAPHLLPDMILRDEEKIKHKKVYRDELCRASIEAAGAAFAAMEPVILNYETGLCNANANRDVELQDGWWVGEGGLGLSDHTVSVLCLNREDGTPLAILFHYGVQSSVLDGSELNAGGKAVSPDIAGIASDYIEKVFKESGTVGLFLLGAAGDQCPVEKTVNETFVQGQRVRKDRREEGFRICEQLGERLGSVVCDIVQKMEGREETSGGRQADDTAEGRAALDEISRGKVRFQVPGKEMERDLKKLRPVKRAEYLASEEKETEVEAVLIGKLAMIGVRPELNCCSGLAISACSPFQDTLICTMVNGAAKYMADRKSYDRFTYEAMNSPFGKGAAETLVQQSVRLLESLNKCRTGRNGGENGET